MGYFSTYLVCLDHGRYCYGLTVCVVNQQLTEVGAESFPVSAPVDSKPYPGNE
jgi:hypothetical protein